MPATEYDKKPLRDFCECGFPATTGSRCRRKCARCALIEADLSAYHPQDRQARRTANLQLQAS
jgi:hypothetical protein